MIDGSFPGALEGLVVLDTTSSLAGTVASSFLADFGATVTMVERPGGSVLRTQPAWPFWGRGKQSRVVDLASPSGRAELAELACAADVVLEAWRPGVAERLGVGDDDLRPGNPRLVYASITGFGRGHRWSNIKAYEPVVMAKVGGLAAFGGLSPRDGPSFVSTPYCSYSAGQLALHGILAALIEREKSGLGQRVDVTLAQGLLAHDPWNWLLQVLVGRFDQAFVSAPPFDQERLVPNSALMIRLMVGLSADGRWMQFSQTTDRLWAAFLRVTGLEWTRHDPRLSAGPGSEDISVRAEFWDLALGAVRSKTYAEWLAVFDEDPDVWAEVFRADSELLRHPQLLADGRTVTIADPVAGAVHQPGPLAVLDHTPARLGSGAPRLDEHDSQSDLPEAEPQPERDVPPSGPPLAGVTIVEFGTFFAAPYGATLLYEMGARVIKVEQLDGDPIRTVMPFPDLGAIKVTSGKESVAVDIGRPEGHAIALELVRRADVALLAFRAGVAGRLAIEPAQLRAVNPEIVVLEAPGYGCGPPCGHRPAFAPTMGAGSGLALRNLGGAPRAAEALGLSSDELKRQCIRLSAGAMAVAQADGFSALAVASTMLLGLLVRARGGPAQSMSTSMLSTMSHALSETMVDYPGLVPLRQPDDQLFGLGPWYRLYRCADGWVFLAAPDVGDQVAVAKECGIATDADDSGVESALTAAFAQRPAAAWEAQLAALDVACVELALEAPDRTIMFGDVGRELGFVIDSFHPLLEAHPRLAPLVRFSRSRTAVGSSPRCGEHTDTVLEELGLHESRRAELRRSEVIA